jgi:hypothetical protein
MVCIAAGLLLLSSAASAERVTCTVNNSKTTYKLDIDWKKETTTISYAHAGNNFKKLFMQALAVRNSASDPALLAEGTPRQWVGTKNKCGIYPTMYFDISNVGGKRVGVVETSYKVASKKCKLRSSDLETLVENITCK